MKDLTGLILIEHLHDIRLHFTDFMVILFPFVMVIFCLFVMVILCPIFTVIRVHYPSNQLKCKCKLGPMWPPGRIVRATDHAALSVSVVLGQRLSVLMPQIADQ